MSVPTYDEKQANAVLVVCADCQQSYYMTKPSKTCQKCQEKTKPLRVRTD